MRADIYQQMARVEDTHWWFRARRAICEHLIRTHIILPANPAILDAGSGTGGNLPMLSKFGRVFAMEMEESARALADARSIVKVEYGHLPEQIPFAPQQFDLITLCDVLEHTDEDFASLQALYARLAPGGTLLLTVPAFSFLWSNHDVIHHHKRRYRIEALKALFERAGYRVTFASYINFWLFPLIAVVRILTRMLGLKSSTQNTELVIPPAPVNGLLKWLFASEGWLLDYMRLPFGVSIVLLAQKVS